MTRDAGGCGRCGHLTAMYRSEGEGVGRSRAPLPGAGVVEADAEEALDEDSPRWVGCVGRVENE